MRNILLLVVTIIGISTLHLKAQVAISEDFDYIPNSNSILDIDSKTKGVLLPSVNRLTMKKLLDKYGERENGMLVFCDENDFSGIYIYSYEKHKWMLILSKVPVKGKQMLTPIDTTDQLTSKSDTIVPSVNAVIAYVKNNSNVDLSGYTTSSVLNASLNKKYDISVADLKFVVKSALKDSINLRIDNSEITSSSSSVSNSPSVLAIKTYIDNLLKDVPKVAAFTDTDTIMTTLYRPEVTDFLPASADDSYYSENYKSTIHYTKNKSLSLIVYKYSSSGSGLTYKNLIRFRLKNWTKAISFIIGSTKFEVNLFRDNRVNEKFYTFSGIKYTIYYRFFNDDDYAYFAIGMKKGPDGNIIKIKILNQYSVYFNTGG